MVDELGGKEGSEVKLCIPFKGKETPNEEAMAGEGMGGFVILEGTAGEFGVKLDDIIGVAGVAGAEEGAGLLAVMEEVGVDGGEGERAAAATASIVALMSSKLDNFLGASVFDDSVFDSGF